MEYLFGNKESSPRWSQLKDSWTVNGRAITPYILILALHMRPWQFVSLAICLSAHAWANNTTDIKINSSVDV